MSQRGVAFATAPRRLRGAVAATSLRRLHEPFIRSLRGPSIWVPRKTRNPFEPRRTIFTAPEARMVVEPRMQLLGLCSFDARRKKQKSRRKIFLGGRKSYLAAEHHTEAAPKKTKKKAEVFPLGRRKILLLRRPPKKPIFGFGRRKNKKAAEKKNVAEKNLWGPIFFGGTSKKLFRRRTP